MLLEAIGLVLGVASLVVSTVVLVLLAAERSR